MNSEEILLPLLAAKFSDDGIRGRTRLQKFVFLIQEKFGKELPGKYNFIPYDYGPFAKPLAEDMHDLREEGFIDKEEIPRGSDAVEHRYKLTEKGEKELEDMLEEFEIDEDIQRKIKENIVEEWDKGSLRALLSYVYSEYPQYAENSVL